MTYARLHATHVRTERSGLFSPSAARAVNNGGFRPASSADHKPPLVQCRCACGGECDSCRKEDASAASQAAMAPSRSTGRPLEASTRADMEARLGHNFGNVRVHHDPDATKGIHARAYTFGQDIVFGAGEYRPESEDGRRLLAHELVHTIQQRSTVQASKSAPAVSREDDPMEREAESAAETAMSATVVGPFHPAGEETLARAEDDDTPKPVCGPDVSKPLERAVFKVIRKFDSWNWLEKRIHCASLFTAPIAFIAWDITELFQDEDFLDYFKPKCATPDTRCSRTVEIDGGCHFTASANYVIFGAMCRQCNDLSMTGKFTDFNEDTMVRMVKTWKTLNLSKDKAAAVRWAKAGYHLWPYETTPDPDRSECATTCDTPCTWNFNVLWLPTNHL